MGLPVPANTTCDIYRHANSPPAAPDVPGVACHLASGYFSEVHQAATTGGVSGSTYRHTHVMLVDLSVDVRDPYLGPATNPNPVPGTEQGASDIGDHVYVPDKNGTLFYVIFVERVGYGSGADHKRAYLQRGTPTWPTNNL